MNYPKLILGLLATTALLNTNGTFPVAAREINPANESLCRKFPLNSQCRDLQPQPAIVQPHQLDRQSFCSRFPFNSQCQDSIEIIKLSLDRSGEKDEWIQIEKKGDRVKLWHSTRVKDGLISGVLNAGLGLIPIPVPLPELNKYSWKDHQTMKVSFQSDGCKNQNCVVSGKANTLIMPKMNLHGGIFTLRYQEEDLERSVSFRIPPEVKAKTPDTLTVNFNN
ncbi:hypothetical protein I4641_17840 [Waterburya agarophytonicola K14]|uniref:Uncharacterized protein n=1 Tax=Waterburya agarophytonicola KI4 TaxID=2874699 RepID=A0A964BSB4_9CYAN|nr:hypothetical protein [Waterburya agarophytonicola]MCC0178833.1 hypothetical protein [Waterburya agarophytonicola KI4]